MTREPWMQPAEERDSFRRIPGADRRLSIVSGSFPIRAGSKVELQGSGQGLQQIQEQQQGQQASVPQAQLPCETPTTNLSITPVAKLSMISRRGSMLGSLKAYYRKLRTFKGTVRALIHLKRTPLSLLSGIKANAPTLPNLSDEQRSVALEVPRISATAASTVQTKVHKLVAEGHVVTEIDPTAGLEVAYRQQGNLDHYTEDNLAKRVSLQQHPHMIALTQRLWNCALRNGEKKLKFSDYETYMLCLHRLILPEFDIAASKELIMDDWKRDSGEQNYLDYAFFHLSMFELVDVSAVDILEESKGVTLEGIKQDLQRELNSDAFAYYRDQVKLAAEANQALERGNNPISASENKQDNNRSRSRDRKRSSSKGAERDGAKGNPPKSTHNESASHHRRSRSGSVASGPDSPKRKFSVQASSKALNLTADTSGPDGNNPGPPPLTTQNYPVETVRVSPRRETAVQQRAISPNVFTRGGGVILSVGTMDGMVISKSISDGSPAGVPAFPRRRSRSASNSSQHRRDQILQSVSGKEDSPRDATYSPGLQVSHIEASGSALRTGVQDSNAPGYLLIPSVANSGKSREPFTVRAAAVAEAAAGMAMSAAPVNARHTFASQRTQHQRASQFTPEGTALSVPSGATRNIPPNFFINNSSLTAPLMTIVSSRAATPRETNSSMRKIQLQFQESVEASTTRPQTPHRGFIGASISSPRASNAITPQVAGIFISAQQKPIRPPSSPRYSIASTPRAGSIMNSDYQAPTSPRKMQQRQLDDRLSLVGPSPISNLTSATTLTINGRMAAHDAHRRQSAITPGPPSQLPSSVGSMMLSTSAADAPTSTTPSQKDDLKALISPRYIVTNPMVPNHHAPNLKQSSVRPQGSVRGFAGVKSNPRMRSSLVTGAASNNLQQQQRQLRQPSERLAVSPGKLG
ncbi:hypothetical protein ON010_g3386 [Phytophthora cinnamomi]|nr:hypothetical protein ON010_g3386 [Phytophthora cinnamomi]